MKSDLTRGKKKHYNRKQKPKITRIENPWEQLKVVADINGSYILWKNNFTGQTRRQYL